MSIRHNSQQSSASPSDASGSPAGDSFSISSTHVHTDISNTPTSAPSNSRCYLHAKVQSKLLAAIITSQGHAPDLVVLAVVARPPDINGKLVQHSALTIHGESTELLDDFACSLNNGWHALTRCWQQLKGNMSSSFATRPLCSVELPV